MSLRFRWSLRWMVAMCVGCGVLGGWLGRAGHGYRHEQQVIKELQNSDLCVIDAGVATVTENEEPPTFPAASADWESWVVSAANTDEALAPAANANNWTATLNAFT